MYVPTELARAFRIDFWEGVGFQAYNMPSLSERGGLQGLVLEGEDKRNTKMPHSLLPCCVLGDLRRLVWVCVHSARLLGKWRRQCTQHTEHSEYGPIQATDYSKQDLR